MERKCKRREAMTAVIYIKRQQRDQKHLWVWGSRMALGRGVSGSGLCSEVSAIGEDQPWGDKREYAQTRQGQVRAFVLYLPDTGNGKGDGEISLQHDGDAQHTSLAPLLWSPGTAQGLAMGYAWWEQPLLFPPPSFFTPARSSEDRFMSLGLL